MSLIGRIAVLIVVGIALYLIRLIPMDETIRKVITVLVILVVMLWILSALGALPA